MRSSWSLLKPKLFTEMATKRWFYATLSHRARVHSHRIFIYYKGSYVGSYFSKIIPRGVFLQGYTKTISFEFAKKVPTRSGH